MESKLTKLKNKRERIYKKIELIASSEKFPSKEEKTEEENEARLWDAYGVGEQFGDEDSSITSGNTSVYSTPLPNAWDHEESGQEVGIAISHSLDEQEATAPRRIFSWDDSDQPLPPRLPRPRESDAGSINGSINSRGSVSSTGMVDFSSGMSGHRGVTRNPRHNSRKRNVRIHYR